MKLLHYSALSLALFCSVNCKATVIYGTQGPVELTTNSAIGNSSFSWSGPTFPNGTGFNAIFGYELYSEPARTQTAAVVVGYGGIVQNANAQAAGEDPWTYAMTLAGNLTPMATTASDGSMGFMAPWAGRWLGWTSAGQVIDANTSSGSVDLGGANWDYQNGAWQMISDFAVDGSTLMAAFSLAHQTCDFSSCTNWNNAGWVEFSVTAGATAGNPFTIDVKRWAYEDTGATLVAGSTSAVSAVPEPASAALMLAGLAGFCATRQRRPLLRKSA